MMEYGKENKAPRVSKVNIADSNVDTGLPKMM